MTGGAVNIISSCNMKGAHFYVIFIKPLLNRNLMQAMYVTLYCLVAIFTKIKDKYINFKNVFYLIQYTPNG